MKTITEILTEIDTEIMLEASTEPRDYRLIKYITNQMPYFYKPIAEKKDGGI